MVPDLDRHKVARICATIANKVGSARSCIYLFIITNLGIRLALSNFIYMS